MMKSDITESDDRPTAPLTSNETTRIRAKFPTKCLVIAFRTIVVICLIFLFIAVIAIYVANEHRASKIEEKIGAYHSNDFLCSNKKAPALDILQSFLNSTVPGVSKIDGPRYGTKAFQISPTAHLQKRSKFIFHHKLPKAYEFQVEFRLNQTVYNDDQYILLVRDAQGRDQFVLRLRLTTKPQSHLIFTTLDGNGNPAEKIIPFPSHELTLGKWHVLELQVSVGDDFRQVSVSIDCDLIIRQSMEFYGRAMDLNGATRIFSRLNYAKFESIGIDVHQMVLIY